MPEETATTTETAAPTTEPQEAAQEATEAVPTASTTGEAPSLLSGVEGDTGRLATDDLTAATDIPEWLRDSDLSPEISGHPVLRGKTQAQVAKELVGAQALIGAEKIVKPGKDASDDDWNNYYTSLGRPETPQGYKLPTEGMPEGIEFDKDRVAAAFQHFHKAGISEQHAAEVMRVYAQNESENLQALKDLEMKQARETDTQLTREWGMAKERNLQLGRKALKDFDETGEIGEWIGENPLAVNDHRFIKLMARVGRAMAEDSVMGSGPTQALEMTPQQARAKILELQSNKEWVARFTNKADPGQKAAAAEWDQLHQWANPGQTGPTGAVM